MNIQSTSHASSFRTKRWIGLLAGLIIITVTVMVIITVHMLHGEARASLQDATDDRLLQIPVQRVSAEAGYSVEVRLTGRVRARRAVQLAFEPGGRVERILVQRGDTVEAGTVLAELDTRRLRSRLAELDARVRETRAGLELAQLEEGRQERLLQDNYASRNAFDQARTHRLTLEARLTGLRGERERLEADLRDSTLRAPFAAQVLDRNIDLGTLVSPGTPAFRLVDVEHLEAHVGLPSRLAWAFEPGEAVTLHRNGDILTGSVRALLTEVDAASRTRTLVVDLDADQAPVPGDVVELRRHRFIDSPGFWVPEVALTAGDRGLWAVLVAEPAAGGVHTVRRASVELLHRSNGRAYVRGTLTEDLPIVEAGAHRVFPGQRVRIAGTAASREG